jgi:hypothetical protein
MQISSHKRVNAIDYFYFLVLMEIYMPRDMILGSAYSSHYFSKKWMRTETLQELIHGTARVARIILSYVDNTVTIDKETLQYVLTCLQVSQAKVALLQTQLDFFMMHLK